MNKHTTEIKYDRQSRDYSVLVNGEYLGSARNYSEGERMANEYITEQAAQEARALPAPVQDFLITLDDAPALPAVFSATSAEPLDAMLQALEQAASLIARLGDDVISQTDEVTVSVCGRPLTTVVVVVALRVARGMVLYNTTGAFDEPDDDEPDDDDVCIDIGPETEIDYADLPF